jgi:hypothetical protein
MFEPIPIPLESVCQSYGIRLVTNGRVPSTLVSLLAYLGEPMYHACKQCDQMNEKNSQIFGKKEAKTATKPKKMPKYLF